VPTLRRARPFHGFPAGFQVGVNIPPGGREIGISREVSQRVWVFGEMLPRRQGSTAPMKPTDTLTVYP
jgi:hypothetical protein